MYGDGLGRLYLYLYLYLFVFICCAFVLLPIFSENKDLYTAVNGGAKCRKWGGLGWLGALKVNGNVTIR